MSPSTCLLFIFIVSTALNTKNKDFQTNTFLDFFFILTPLTPIMTYLRPLKTVNSVISLCPFINNNNLIVLIQQFSYVFESGRGFHTFFTHKFNVSNNKPSKIKSYCYPHLPTPCCLLCVPNWERLSVRSERFV